MPINLIDDKNQIIAHLDNVKFTEDDGERYYRAASGDEKYYIDVRYVPNEISNWIPDSCVLYLFENSYLNAENDVFEIYEDTLKDEKIGWMFPVAILESNENDYTSFKNINNYKHIAYDLLLRRDITVQYKESYAYDYYTLSEMYPDLIVCILHKPTIEKICDFDLNEYILSLYLYGYALYCGNNKACKLYDMPSYISEMRSLSRRRVIIRKSGFKINENPYIKSLFVDHLLQSDHCLVRFILLYQVMEYFMSILFENKFKQALEDFSNKKISKNDLRDRINFESRERDLIRNIVNKVKLNSSFSSLAINEFDSMLTDLGCLNTSDLASKIYDVRNIVTHRYRDLTLKPEIFLKVTELFERLITELLIQYAPSWLFSSH